MARADVEGGIVDTFKALFGGKRRDTAGEAAEAAKVTTEEDTWLQGQIDGNDQIDEYDEALLAFLRQDSGR
jgi:hypothetical protein